MRGNDARGGGYHVALAAALTTAALLLSSCGSGSPAAKSSVAKVAVGLDDCGHGWADPHPGHQVFELHNTTVAGVEAYLESATDGAIYLDVESIGPNASERASVTLGNGTYRFVCLPADHDPVEAAKVTISGAGKVDGLTPGVKPVTQNDLIPALKIYQGWITRRLPVLLKQVKQLQSDVTAGDLGAAKRSWLTAHMTYETLGAAYDAFGDFDAAINGTPSPGTSALGDAHLEGFHRIEAMLWHGKIATEIGPHTARLVKAVSGLRTAFTQDRIDPVDIGLRSHEILENALQFELTGRTDAGSHTNLATIDANLTGTREALAPIKTILSSRYPDLAATEKAIDIAQRLVSSYRHDGQWTPLNSLTRSQREELNAQIGATLELLAPVAAITDPRRAA
ncbi:MAG: EfeM/EfeO family lipoprotein [Aeromicrobium sp.]|nr:EfeM/EfeO family lipoprotein [Aeromicrobium sp.]